MPKLTIISPRWPTDSFWAKMYFQFPLLSLTTLAALTPPEYEVAIYDENVESIPFEAETDLVAITAMTALAPRAYALCAEYRRRGVITVLGGIHATCCPDEASQHADVVVLGEAESVWSKVLADFKAGSLQRRYSSATLCDFSQSPVPRHELLQGKPYFFTKTIQLSRGCPHDCDFCAVTSFYGRTYRSKNLDRAMTEITAVTKGKGFLLFVDDNIVGARAYTLALLQRLADLNLKWLSHATVSVAEDEEMLLWLKRSGCIGLFIGFESLSQQTLTGMGKLTNKPQRYLQSVSKLHDYGIGVEGAFILGRDEDDESVFENTVSFITKAKIDGVHFSINTPLPATALYRRLEAQARIIDRDWSKYDLTNVVFKPQQMTPERLQDGFYQCYKEVYSARSILTRLWRPRRSLQIFGPLNWGIRSASKKAGYFEPR